MNVGGPAVLLSDLIHNLPREDFEHILITGRCLPNEIDYLDSHPLDSRIIYINEIKRTSLPIGDLKSFVKLVRILRELQPNIIHTHTSKAGVLGRLAARIGAPKAKVVHTYHGHLLYGYFSQWKTNLIVITERLLARITDNLVAVTSKVKSDLQGVGVGKDSQWLIIHPGISTPKSIDKTTARSSLGVAKNQFVLAWIGRFTDIKNPMLAIKSFENIPIKLRANITMIMAGSGELFDECQSYSRDRKLGIHFTGWVSDVSPILDSASLLFMTSKNEGMPVVIVESAFRGIATLSTNVGGVEEFIEQNVTGWLTNQSVIEISQKISELSSSSKLGEVGLNAKNLALSEYGVDNMVHKHTNMYRNLVTLDQ